MKAREAIGLIITLLSLLIFAYEILYVGLIGGRIGATVEKTIGATVEKTPIVTFDALLISAGFLLILIGPALWLGEVPANLKKLIEAKTGRKLS
ncbi:MAG: hypothetical protein QN229_04485 [Desulfurococcaceae archaeon TW002]